MLYYNLKEKALGFIRGVLGAGAGSSVRPALIPVYIPAGGHTRAPR